MALFPRGSTALFTGRRPFRVATTSPTPTLLTVTLPALTLPALTVALPALTLPALTVALPALTLPVLTFPVPTSRAFTSRVTVPPPSP